MIRNITLSRKQIIAYGVAIALVSSGIGYGISRLNSPKTLSPTSEASDRKVLYWYDPMVPGQHFEKPGKSPFMDMDLVPKYADEDAKGSGVKIDPGRLQNLGLRLAQVERTDFALDLTVAGTLEFNQRDVAIVQARADGFVQRVYARAPGDIVGVGAPLADILIPSWAAAQTEYLAVRRTTDPALERAARQRLTLLGMSQGLIDQVSRSGKPNTVVTITTPVGGAIQTLDVRQGMTVNSGQTLAQVSGLSSVWLNAAVPEALASQVGLGQPVKAELSAFPGESFSGKVSAILPTAQSESRTLSVRVELANRNGRLRPGMYATVHFPGNTASALIVPSEAVIRTGKRTIVMLSKGAGRFEPVEIQVGRESGNRTEVLAGLTEGETVVASGQFLIDSEANLSGISAKAIPDSEGGGQETTAKVFTAQGRIEALTNDKVTLSHGPVPALSWPAMTMTFKLASPAIATGLKAGDQVDFSFAQKADGPVVETMRKGTAQ
jgi:Cu(I)/Ag(I) efflux system membrane fusion protein